MQVQQSTTNNDKCRLSNGPDGFHSDAIPKNTYIHAIHEMLEEASPEQVKRIYHLIHGFLS